MKNIFRDSAPIRLLESTQKGELGRGNLGVIISRAGIGKTACLVHIALYGIFMGDRIVHIAFDDMPDKVSAFYQSVFNDIAKDGELSDHSKYIKVMETNRLIISIQGDKHIFERVEKSLLNITEHGRFNPDRIFIDDLNFEKADENFFKRFKELSESLNAETWFTALSHRHIKERNKRGIPYPCNNIDDIFSIIMEMEPEKSGIYLKLLKDHNRESIRDIKVKL